MRYLDADTRVLEWSSEEFFIPYFDPSSGRARRYFPDFWARIKDKTIVFEIKPYKQTIPPILPKKGINVPKKGRIIKEAMTYMTNDAKWKAAIKYCEERKWEFKILTEKELAFPQYK